MWYYLLCLDRNSAEIGVVCSINQISTVIAGKSNLGGIRPEILNHQYVIDAFPDITQVATDKKVVNPWDILYSIFI